MALVRKRPDATPAASPNTGGAAEALRSGTPDERRAAARALAADTSNVPLLVAALAAETVPHVREAILAGLARTDTPEAADAILPLLRSEDAGERTLGLDALRAMPIAIAALLPLVLRDPDPDVRLLASDLAREMSPEAATALLTPVLAGDAEVNVCAAAIEVLAERGTADAVPALRDVARRFPNDPFLGFAADAAIARIGAGAGTA